MPEKPFDDGLLLVLFASLWFSMATLMVKFLGPGVPAVWVTFMRSAVSVPLLLFIMRRKGTAIASSNWSRLLLRGIWGSLAMFCLFWSLPRMPAANTLILSHASPLYAALWGVLFMGERLDKAAFMCLAVAFVGVYLALRPSLAFDSAPYLAALASGFFSSLAFTAIKSLSRTEPAPRIIFYFGLVGTLAFLPGAALSGYRPTVIEWGGMCCVAVTATVGQLFLTAGIGRAPVSRASAGALFIVVLNIAGAWLIWGELPDARTWLGCVLISLGVLGLSSGVRRRLFSGV